MKRVFLIGYILVFSISLVWFHKEKAEMEVVHVTDTVYVHGKVDKHKLCEAFVLVESSGNHNAVNKISGASGVLQIMPVMVEEANRLLGYKKYSIEDRFNAQRSKEIFHIIMRHKNPDYDLAKACYIWNPNGKTDYTKKVEENYKELINN